MKMRKWEFNLSITHDADFGIQICNNIYFTTRSSNLQLIQYKILHRIPDTGQNLLCTSDICPHCTQNSPDSSIHATWHCTPVLHFWGKITGSLLVFLGGLAPLPHCSYQEILNNLSKKNRRLLLVAPTMATSWKSSKKLDVRLYCNRNIITLQQDATYSSFIRFLQT